MWRNGTPYSSRFANLRLTIYRLTKHNHRRDLQVGTPLSQSTCLTTTAMRASVHLAVPSPHRHVSCGTHLVQAIVQPYVHSVSTTTDKTMEWNTFWGWVVDTVTPWYLCACARACERYIKQKFEKIQNILEKSDKPFNSQTEVWAVQTQLNASWTIWKILGKLWVVFRVTWHSSIFWVWNWVNTAHWSSRHLYTCVCACERYNNSPNTFSDWNWVDTPHWSS